MTIRSTLYTAPPLKDEDWRVIAAQASKEVDPAKLTRLVAKLCSSLDDRDKQALAAKTSIESRLNSSESTQ
jgi:hypothetical protein